MIRDKIIDYTEHQEASGTADCHERYPARNRLSAGNFNGNKNLKCVF